MWKAVVSLAIPALFVAPAPAAAVVPGPALWRNVVSSPEAELMSRLITMTNQQRHAAGCARLDVDHELVVASLRQSDYMADTGSFSHVGRGGSDFVVRARAAGYAQPAGENIAWGYGSADEVMAAWMASPGHRRNILNCDVKSIGTGVRYAANGTPYYTQVFGWV